MSLIRQKEFEKFRTSALYQYHQLTKHSINSLLADRSSLDWNNQPNPFRHYQGTDHFLLPRNIKRSSLGYFDLLQEDTQIKSVELNSNFLSELLFYSMSISAWKQIVGTEHCWALRVNPSSGNLHPTEVHIAIDSLSDLNSGIYHYQVDNHALELRSTDNPFSNVNQAKVIICLTSIFWRESWKYRKRAFRYCQHDLGHALCAITLSASLLGWQTEVIGEFVDSHIEQLFGLTESDEKPMLLIALKPMGKSNSPLQIPIEIPNLKFSGKPNILSSEVIKYDAIENIYLASRKEIKNDINKTKIHLEQTWQNIFEDEGSFRDSKILSLPNAQENITKKQANAQTIIRRRRSCLSLDGQQWMSLEQLSTIIWAITGSFQADFFLSDSFIHLIIYVHRVHDLESGLYLYERKNHSLIQLAQGDVKQTAKLFSCFQDIAADGCFAVSMIADLLTAYELFGDRSYRYVHYQAGYIGQLLYLTSLALGLESTGIGCFIDDEINNMLHLAPGFEVIYNFTVGRAVADLRLTDLPAYDFLQ